ncbi:TPR-like protein [Irpex rosettiformis]|uniref:TPR-like protein n=1 Tax=Irpex rosettiformis TaxID=378272 RepID=A0ACB8TV50_9APHY|nr:TPR-like protein [Irpex rosettiformis]
MSHDGKESENSIQRRRLSDLWHEVFHRYEETENPNDLEQAMEIAQRVLELTPKGDQDYLSHLMSFAITLYARYERYGNLEDLRKSVETKVLVCDSTPDDHPHRPSRLHNLANSLLSRFKSLGDLQDLDAAVDAERRVVELTPLDDSRRSVRLCALGNALETRFNRTGCVSDIEEALEKKLLSVELLPDDHPYKPGMLSALGNTYDTKFRRFGSIDDLNAAVDIQRQAAQLSSDTPSTESIILNSFGNALEARFSHLGNDEDLEAAVAAKTRAVELIPDNHPHQPSNLNNLGRVLIVRFERFGLIRDIDASITAGKRAVDLTADQNPGKPMWLTNLSRSYLARFERFGSTNDLHLAIQSVSQAVDLTPDDHPDKPMRLSNLAHALKGRFERLGDMEALDTAVEMHTRAVDLTSDSNPDKPGWLSNLGLAHQTKFECFGRLEDLELAVSLNTRAVELAPNGHQYKSGWLSNLGGALEVRFGRLGRLEDLNAAVEAKTRAVDLTPDNHPYKVSYTINLSVTLGNRFERLGALDDLEAAIRGHTRAVQLTADNHSGKPSALLNLAGMLETRYEHLSELDDLQAAIELKQRALELIPSDHRSGRARVLRSLGVSLGTRFRRFEDLADLETAIALLRSAVELLPEETRPTNPGYLSSLGNALEMRFIHKGDRQDLEEAVGIQRQVIHLVSDDHPEKPGFLGNLSRTLTTRFTHLGDHEDLSQALEASTHAANLIPKRHSLRTLCLENLGDILLTRADSSNATADDIQKAIEVYTEASQEKSGAPYSRLMAGISSLNLLTLSSGPSSCSSEVLLEAHERVLSLVPQVVWLGHNVFRRYKELERFGTLANRAAADAIAVGECTRALEWLEGNRTVVWSQMLNLRTPITELKDQYPQLALDLERISHRLQHASITTADGGRISQSLLQDPSTFDEESPQVPVSLESQAKGTYSLALEYEQILANIRAIEGFESFLQPKTLLQLAPACEPGPVIVINVHKLRCDALILHYPANLLHVPLPAFSYDQAKTLQVQLWNVLREQRLLERSRSSVRRNASDSRRAWTRPNQQPSQTSSDDIISNILKELWNRVVKPIVDVIKHLLIPRADGTLPHITWCPTGPLVFLPLHAAGIYDKLEVGMGDAQITTLADVAVSSYTPTIQALLRPRSQSSKYSHGTGYPKILAVAEPNADGHTPIPETEEEVEVIRSIFPNSTTTCVRDEATISTVSENMETHDWVHLACHGIQNYSDSTKSAFILHGGKKMELSTLVPKSLPNAELAVLSACQTATGNESLSEEAVHLAAAMLSVGYRSIIGTMWSISDDSGPTVSKKFYNILRKQIEAGDELRPAYALHESIKGLRNELGEDSFIEWVPFVHFGI